MNRKTEHAEVDSLAILICVHNRKTTTDRCLASLFAQLDHGLNNVDVYLADDGSTDGTSELVSEKYPKVKLLQGDGSLFWVGGTNLAWRDAAKKKYSHYLWLNDDVELLEGAIVRLLDDYCELKESVGDKGCILVGPMVDSQGNTSYSGVVRNSSWHPLRYSQVEPNGKLQECHTINGNLVLIENAVFETVGYLDDSLKHRGGDYDYGLRAKKKGFSLWVAKDFSGKCDRNLQKDTWMDHEMRVSQRIKLMLSPKGMPIRETYRFIRKHGGTFWPVLLLGPYMKFVLRLFGFYKYKAS